MDAARDWGDQTYPHRRRRASDEEPEADHSCCCYLHLRPALLAADMGVSAGHDLDALWARPRRTTIWTRQDAVLLLESRQRRLWRPTAPWPPACTGWCGSAPRSGIRGYADLRVPWNTATSTLDVEILRTWRDGRWWPDADGDQRHGRGAHPAPRRGPRRRLHRPCARPCSCTTASSCPASWRPPTPSPNTDCPALDGLFVLSAAGSCGSDGVEGHCSRASPCSRIESLEWGA